MTWYSLSLQYFVVDDLLIPALFLLLLKCPKYRWTLSILDATQQYANGTSKARGNAHALTHARLQKSGELKINSTRSLKNIPSARNIANTLGGPDLPPGNA